MAVYGISEADITPGRISAGVWTELTTDADGDAEVTFAQLLARAEAHMAALMRGTPAVAANIALCVPYVETLTVYHAHLRRAQNDPAYQIPDAVKEQYKEAKAWAETTGRDLVAVEGESAEVTGGSEYDAPDSKFSLTQMDRM